VSGLKTKSDLKKRKNVVKKLIELTVNIARDLSDLLLMFTSAILDLNKTWLNVQKKEAAGSEL